MLAIPMVIITIPMIFPVITALESDPIWFGVITVLMLELAVIMPPIRIKIYGLNRTAPEMAVGRIFKGVLPFVAVV